MKAVIYARYSSDNQREESIEGQLRECYEYAKYNDIEIIGEYIDRAFSAKTDDRPDFQRLIADSNRKFFDAVLVWRSATLFNSIVVFYFYQTLFVEYNDDFILITNIFRKTYKIRYNDIIKVKTNIKIFTKEKIFLYRVQFFMV